MLFLSIDTHDPTPVYKQIVDRMRNEIAAGRLKPGDPLPSVRELAEALGVNVNTVNRAYQILKGMKVIVIRQARGAIIAPNIGDVLGSNDNALLLRSEIEGLLKEARRLGFDSKEVVRIIRESKTEEF